MVQPLHPWPPPPGEPERFRSVSGVPPQDLACWLNDGTAGDYDFHSLYPMPDGTLTIVFELVPPPPEREPRAGSPRPFGVSD